MSAKSLSLLFLIEFSLLFACVEEASAQVLIEYADPAEGLVENWNWANDQAQNQNSVWLGYEVNLRHDEKLEIGLSSRRENYYQWNNRNSWRRFGDWNFDGAGWHNGLSIRALQNGNRSLQQDHEVETTAMVLAKYEQGAFIEFRVIPVNSIVDWRESPIYWLGTVSQDESFRHLIGLRNQELTDRVQRTLIRAIGLHQTADRESYLETVFNDEQTAQMRGAALESLAQHESSRVEDLLREVAEDGNESALIRRIAISALSRYDSQVTQESLMLLAGEFNPRFIRLEAIESISNYQTSDAADLLESFVEQNNQEEVLRVALYGLSRFADRFDSIAGFALEHSNANIREIALELMVAMNSNDAFEMLVQIINNDPSSNVRTEAVEELGGYPAETALAILIELAEGVSDYGIDVRGQAVETLAEFPAALVSERLNLLAWSDNNQQIRDEAIESLADLDDIEANNHLLQIARNHPSARTREEALQELENNVL